MDSNHKIMLQSKAKTKKCKYIQGTGGMQINIVIAIPHANLHMIYITLVMPTNIGCAKSDRWTHGHICHLSELNILYYDLPFNRQVWLKYA